MDPKKVLCFLLVIGSVLAAKVDRPEKKPKNENARKGLKKMLDELDTGKDEAEDGKGNKLRRGKSRTDKAGNKVTRMDQEYQGLPVLGGQVIVRESEEHEVKVLGKDGKPSGETVKVGKEKKVSGKCRNCG